VDHADAAPADRYLVGEHQEVAGSPKNCPCLHGDGPDLYGSWVLMCPTRTSGLK